MMGILYVGAIPCGCPRLHLYQIQDRQILLNPTYENYPKGTHKGVPLRHNKPSISYIIC